MTAKLLSSAAGERKALELARALYNQGRLDAAALVEQMVLKDGSAEAKHLWRLTQSARAPANQHLLINNSQRTRAFRTALESVITPNCTVLEIGTGSGILSMLAARVGARHVYTCERQILMARVADEIVKDNNLIDSITVIAKGADQLKLGAEIPERVDLILCDVFTGSLLEAGGLGLVARAAQNFLKPGGSIIPGFGAIRGELVGGEDLEALCRCSNNDGMILRRFNLFSPTKLVLQPDQFDKLEYQTYSEAFDCFDFKIGKSNGDQGEQRSIEIEITKPGNVTGLLQWTDVELTPGVRLQAAPGESIRWPRFLHVFPELVQIRSEQVMRLNLHHDGRQFSVWPSPLT